jgi:hypothetical protein
MAGKIKDRTNQTYGRLKVIQLNRIEKGTSVWECLCMCGKTTFVRSGSFSKVKSCGCIQKEKLRNQTGENHPNYKGFQEINGGYWYRTKNNAKIRNIDFSITIQEAWEIFEIQNKRCALTGQKLTFSTWTKQTEQTASLDRINASKPYTKDNVQWTHKDVNMCKQSLSNEDFIKMCQMVINYRK